VVGVVGLFPFYFSALFRLASPLPRHSYSELPQCAVVFSDTIYAFIILDRNEKIK
jgi:hypothetical protein